MPPIDLHCRHVLAREVVGRVGHQHTGLPHCSVSNDDTLDWSRCRRHDNNGANATTKTIRSWG